MRRYLSILLLVLFVSLAGCADNASRSTGIYMLMDTSGTYAKELDKAQGIIKYLLGTLQSGDSFAVARIDTGSFSEKDIIAKVQFDNRPSVANQQKRAFAKEIDDFVSTVKGSRYTDITGGLLQATEYLNETGVGKKHILIFSDLQEDIKEGYVRDIPFDIPGFNVIALNVTKLRVDNVDPRVYMGRLEEWEKRVKDGGGKWKVVNDLDRLETMLAD
ncbi:MAG: VWA domain-containing protein [Proteobacteria bacterium]|nr:VWA domain-containing protein [Pseudomonadota bacterium]